MIYQSRAKVVRKRPVIHKVGSYEKKNGTRVSRHLRGSGVKTSRPSKTVGTSYGVVEFPTQEINWRNAKYIDGANGPYDLAESIRNARVGFKINWEWIGQTSPEDLLSEFKDHLEKKGYVHHEMSAEQVMEYTGAEESELPPLVYVRWSKGNKNIVASEWDGGSPFA